MPSLSVKPDIKNIQNVQPTFISREVDDKWDQNYLKKTIINSHIEENKNLRAKVWNIQKENRQMYA